MPLNEETAHAAWVDAWLERTLVSRDVPATKLVSLFERAMGALWRRSQSTLGEITVAAIVDRVLYNAMEKYPALSTLKIEGTRVSFDGLRQGDRIALDVRDAMRFVLVEFLTVLGNLTDEILTPGLHAELARVELDEVGSPGTDDDAKEGGS